MSVYEDCAICRHYPCQCPTRHTAQGEGSGSYTEPPTDYTFVPGAETLPDKLDKRESVDPPRDFHPEDFEVQTPPPEGPPMDPPDEEPLPYCRSQQESLDAIADALLFILEELREIRGLLAPKASKGRGWEYPR